MVVFFLLSSYFICSSTVLIMVSHLLSHPTGVFFSPLATYLFSWQNYMLSEENQWKNTKHTETLVNLYHFIAHQIQFMNRRPVVPMKSRLIENTEETNRKLGHLTEIKIKASVRITSILHSIKWYSIFFIQDRKQH